MKEPIPLMSKNIRLTKTETSLKRPTAVEERYSEEIFCKNFLRKTAVLLLCCLAGIGFLKAQPYCSMACNNLLSVALPDECEAEILPDMVLENFGNINACNPNGDTAFLVTVFAPWGGAIPTSPVVTSDEIGLTLTVTVQHIATGNSCWGMILVVDNLPPQITCPPDDTLACTIAPDTSITGVPIFTDCSIFDTSFTDVVQVNNCVGDFSAIITRTWSALDVHGNYDACSQIIRIAKPVSADVVFPSNRDGITGPALDCVNPNTSPNNTGRPSIGGQAIPNGSGYCNMSVTHTDQVLPTCQNSYKILRTWTVVLWCTSQILNHTQIIAVKDTKKPTLVCPPDFIAGTTSSLNCKADIFMPQVAITDDCSTTFTTTMNTPVGLITGNGGWIYNVNPGVYTVQYNVTDNCGNTATCTTKLTVVDDDAPIVICDQFTTVTLNSNGIGVVFAQTFDDGSYDNCTAITLSARRMTVACGTQPVFAPSVKFCCDDVGDDIQVEMRATDQAGNTNSCMVIVHVDDKTKPLMTCPNDISIHCTEDPDDLILTGQPTVVEACGLASLTHTDLENVNTCYVGSIVRTWTATDVNGNSSTCSHTITLTDNTQPLITFPPNYTAPTCTSIASLDPANLPAPYNYPVIIKDCELMATSHTDQVFTVAGQACFQIKRTWKVINWCTYNGGSTGIWEQAQYITVTDNQSPVFTCPANFTVGVGTNCKATVTLPAIGIIQDCSPNITVTVSNPFGNGYGPFTNVNPGTYTATYTVSDGCNNTATCSLQFTVVDNKAPTPYCKAGLNVEIMPNDSDGDGIIDGGMIELWASDFNDNSFDNCNSVLSYSFSGTANEPNRVFDCDDVGQNLLQIWVSDASGNKDFCETILNLQDNLGWCSGALFAGIGGSVTNEMGQSMEDVQVSVNDGVSPPTMTNSQGNFSFAALQFGNDYTVSVEKDTLLLNGVSTFDIVLIRKHILASEFLATPYKIIAADVNRSGAVTTTDLVAIQKAILHVTDEFPNNKSWRFVDGDYDFQNPLNPLAEVFPEVFNINNLSGNMLNLSFIGIKVGDVNDSAQPNNFAQTNEDRTSESLQFLVADQPFEPGVEMAVDFTVQHFRDIVGYQFTLHFDPAALEFLRLEKGGLASVGEHNFGFRFLDDGILTTSWNDFQPVSLTDETVLFRLIFQSKTSGTLAQNLRISSDFTAAEAYHEDGQMLGVNLDFTPAPSIINHQSSIRIFPNPFSERTTVGFYLPEAQEATLTIFDAAGRQVKMVRGNFAAGWNEVKIESSALAGAGTYYFRWATAGETRAGKFILIE